MSLKAATNRVADAHDQAPVFTVAQESDPATSLKNLIALVAHAERPYENVAEQIEDKAYELCELGNLPIVVEELTHLTTFYESLSDKNDEQCRDLADVYLLVGQIHQYAGFFTESIGWFTKSSIVDDRYDASYHSMGLSYVQLHQIENAIKCYEQELQVAEGNYYTYLLLASLYEQEQRPDKVEECLKTLLERDSANIQALHSLIVHYEKSNQEIDTSLLVRRLLGVNRKLSRVEVMIKSFYLCREGHLAEVLKGIDTWNSGTDTVTITDLIKAHVCNEMRQFKKCRQVLQAFKVRNHARVDIMMGKLLEFKTIFGETAAENLRKMLLIPASKKEHIL